MALRAPGSQWAAGGVVLLLALPLAPPAAAADRGLGRTSVLAGFQTTVDVSDYARIDLDQQYVNQQVALATQDAFEAARSVYEKGAFSKSLAKLQLGQALGLTVPAKTALAGRTANGATVTAVAPTNYQPSDTTLVVQYVSDGCHVGGLEATSPITDGCLSPNGTLYIKGTKVPYSGYNPLTDTTNGRSLQSFSTDADTTMRNPGSDTFFSTFETFVQYYGSTSYADDIVQAAFLGRPTSLSNGNMDFSLFGYDGRAEAVQVATAFMATALQLLAELEAAVYGCLRCGGADCRTDALGSLDKAVALYTGSLEGAAGSSGDGTSLYSLAERRGIDFFTAATGTAQVNTDIMALFDEMKAALGDGNCAAARSTKLRIAQLVFVPLVQSTIRSTLILNATTADEADEVQGMAYAASVLPLVANCSAVEADTVYSELQGASPDFGQVKGALERTYGCMGISCADVGGYWDTGNQDYFPGAAPCSGAGRAIAVTTSVLLALLLAGAALLA